MQVAITLWFKEPLFSSQSVYWWKDMHVFLSFCHFSEKLLRLILVEMLPTTIMLILERWCQFYFYYLVISALLLLILHQDAPVQDLSIVKIYSALMDCLTVSIKLNTKLNAFSISNFNSASQKSKSFGKLCTAADCGHSSQPVSDLTEFLVADAVTWAACYNHSLSVCRLPRCVWWPNGAR